VTNAVQLIAPNRPRRILDRAGVERGPPDLHRLVFVDRYGMARLPLEALAGVAKACAAAEPQRVVGYLDDEEEELRLRGNQPGERWYHQYRRELSPGFALARQWAGLEGEAEMLRKEISPAGGPDLHCRLRSQERRAGAQGRGRLLRALEGR
jgi:hypothetical protein